MKAVCRLSISVLLFLFGATRTLTADFDGDPCS